MAFPQPPPESPFEGTSQRLYHHDVNPHFLKSSGSNSRTNENIPIYYEEVKSVRPPDAIGHVLPSSGVLGRAPVTLSLWRDNYLIDVAG